MTIQVSWGNLEKTHVLYTFEGAWTWQEFHAANDIAQRLATMVDYPVRELIDMTGADDLPSNGTLRLNVMSHVKMFVRYAHDNDCHIIMVGVKPILKALWDTFRAISGPNLATNVCFVKTMEDAYGLLNQRQAALLAS